jgi:4-hydroxy-tetrahydrodipicolinate reductase
MNLLVLGKGKTGALVAEIARERGHSVTAVGSADNTAGGALTPERLSDIDVVIDFTTPDAVIHNITACAHAKKNMVVGTTGWYAHTAKVRELVELSATGFVFGSNFSIGVNIFFESVRAAAPALRFGYSARIMERHHTQKKDAPSGTAVTIQRLMGEAAPGTEPVEIVSVREGEVVGTHAVLLDSDNDTMMLTHDAKSRRGFAEGAVRAAEWIAGKQGFYEFKDIFRELP